MLYLTPTFLFEDEVRSHFIPGQKKRRHRQGERYRGWSLGAQLSLHHPLVANICSAFQTDNTHLHWMLNCTTSEQSHICRTFMSQEFMKHAWARKKNVQERHGKICYHWLYMMGFQDEYTHLWNSMLACAWEFPRFLVAFFFSAEVQSVSNFLCGHCATGMMKPPLGMVIDFWWLPGGWTPASSAHSNTPAGYPPWFCWRQPIRQLFMFSSN